MLNDEEMTQYE